MAIKTAKLLWILTLGALAISCTAQDLGEKYTEVSEEESGIQFYGPGLEGGFREFLSGQTRQFVRRTSGRYGPKTGNFPLAVIFFTETPPDRHFTRAPNVTKMVKKWGFFENRTIERGAGGNTFNAIGRIDYLAFTADGISCVNWVQTAGTAEGRGVGTALQAGYYCKGMGPAMDEGEAKSIVKRIGHRDYGRIDPPN